MDVTKRVDHLKNVIIISCGTAPVSLIPPMDLFKSKRLDLEWKETRCYDDNKSLYGGTNVRWLAKIFSTYKIPCLLIFEGIKYHFDNAIMDKAEELTIML